MFSTKFLPILTGWIENCILQGNIAYILGEFFYILIHLRNGDAYFWKTIFQGIYFDFYSMWDPEITRRFFSLPDFFYQKIVCLGSSSRSVCAKGNNYTQALLPKSLNFYPNTLISLWNLTLYFVVHSILVIFIADTIILLKRISIWQLFFNNCVFYFSSIF